MKRKNLSLLCSMLVLVTLVSSTTIDTIAQTSTQQQFQLKEDTARQKYALHSFTVHVQPDTNERKFLLSVNNPFGELLQITVTGDGSSGFRDTTSQLTYRKRINMRNADDGNYLLKVSGDTKNFTRTITIANAGYNGELLIE